MDSQPPNQGKKYGRGFYSETIIKHDQESEEDQHGAAKRTKLLWQIRTDLHSPIIQNINLFLKPTHLAPATRWTIFPEEKHISFPVDTFKPIVQMQHYAEPFQLPRNVAIERLRRQYQGKGIKQYLDKLGILERDILPVYVLQKLLPRTDKFGLYKTINYLPLELFDDEEYDSRSWHSWMDHGLLDGVRHPIPGKAFLPKSSKAEIPTNAVDSLNYLYEWINVAVNNYHPDTKLWSVTTLDGFMKTYKIPRIQLMFKAENPKTFAKRIEAALNLRNETENRIRYELYLDCMLAVGAVDIDPDWIAISVNSAKRDKSTLKVEYYVDTLIEQVKISYQRCMFELQFLDMVKQDPYTYKFLTVPKKTVEKVPKKGKFDTGLVKNFKELRSYFKWSSLYVYTQAYRGMGFIHVECTRIETYNLFSTSHGKSVKLDEFEAMQQHNQIKVMRTLQTDWLHKISSIIRVAFGDLGKGWYDMNQRMYGVYDISKLQRFNQAILHRMQYSLRVMVLFSAESFANLVALPCEKCLQCQDDYAWDSDFIISPFKSTFASLFNLTLRMSADGAYFTTDIEVFGRTMINILDSTIRGTHTIKQVHPMFLANLKFPEDLYLSSMGLLNERICGFRETIRISYEKSLIPLKAYAKFFDSHIPLYMLDVNEYIEKYNEDGHMASEYKEEIYTQFKMKEMLEMTLPEKIIVGPYTVIVEPLKELLISKRFELAQKLLDQFAQRMRKAVNDVLDEYHLMNMRLDEKPTNIEHVFEIKEWLETIPMLVRGFDENTKRYVMEYDVLDYFWYNLTDEDFDNKWLAVGWPLKIMKHVDATNEMLYEEVDKFQKIHMNDELVLEERIEGLTVQVTNMSAIRDFTKIHETAVDIRRLWKQLKESQEQGLLLNQRQKLFGMPVIPFENISKLIKEFEPYYNLWVTASDWLKYYEIWMDNPLVNIDETLIEPTVADMYKIMLKSTRTFSDIPAVANVAAEMKNQMDDFRPLIQLIIAVRNAGMKERHWEELSNATGVNIVWTPTLTFKDCLAAGIQNVSEEMIKISEMASKEYSIEQTLNRMEEDWESNLLDLISYKKSGTYIMRVTDEIQQMLDDHILLTQQISFSPYKAAFEERIDEWEAKLRLTYDVIEEWIEVQRQWMYLEPIFTSEDIASQLPTETKKYRAVDRTWRRIMRGAKECPKMLIMCPDKSLLESLKDANHMLEVVQKGLSDYLEYKRMIFPRLFFLSDDELLEILAQARNPLAVQPHLRKCFENIASLTFEEDLKITQMHSSEEECVDLRPTLYPVGSVENWLLVVEDCMRNTVRSTLGDSLLDIYTLHRQEWVLKWPGQVVIAGSQTYWTTGVEEGILKNALHEFFDVLLENLDALRSLVKGSLSFLKREVLSALIVIEVHARDVTQILVDNNVMNVNDFAWISQLRYYWIEENLKVRAVNAQFPYGYEYLGNSGRLVITPLTDRCYLTLTGALHLKFGGAPAGPAGTGKTETTKDLAKAFARQCVVFNCSDQLDFMAMGKFFKGLASSGAWACFDEFNRIDIEVLSVIAQQIMTIQKAQQARLERFMFEGSDIALKESCAVFITMNPGYAGRTELPDNLKALFRPVAMMIPDYTLIAEISLFSFGFSNAKQLANKITTTFKLSSEQLSSQDHYDFGMRAVKTVIAVAGNLKRERPNMEEKQIVLRALRDVNVPKFLKDDLKLFNGIVSDLFPRMVEETIDYGILEGSIRQCCVKKGLEDVDEYVRKVIQLYETTVVRHGLMLVGPTGSGKTKCYRVLKDAMTALKGQPSPSGHPFQPVHTYVLNPKSITMGQLYGEFDLQTHEWTDGILPCLVRIGVSAENKDKRWYVFDGPVDAVWIENMNTVLDDNKKLCLSSGEIIKLRDTQTMMFEVADLAVASPATVSRCGMVYLEPSVLGLQPFINCWTNQLPTIAMQYMETFLELIEIYLYPALELLRGSLKEILISVDSALVLCFLRLIDYFLGPLAGRDNKPPPPPQFLILIPGLLIPWVTFALTWSVGATCDFNSRVIFSNWLRDVMVTNNHGPFYPKEGLVYDYKLHDGGFTTPTSDGDPAAPKWQNWMHKVDEFVITVDMKYSDIEIPTIDNVRSSELMGMLITNENNVLCVGPTGTGKTLTVSAKLNKNMHKKYICDFISFSARTSANQTQDLIDSKLDRRRKGVFGPPMMKRQILFIDDFNMPALEVYGAQPPIELIRQWMDFGGWYDRKNVGDFRKIIDVNFVTAMGPPGGGRNPITARLLRHFHYIAFIEMQDDSKITIFGKILNFWLNRTEGFITFSDDLLRTTLEIYSTILKELLPTPAKTHYTFNLRDLSKVFQGILMCHPEHITELDEIVRLWYHECCRVFQDRLVNDADRDWFDSLLKQMIDTRFRMNSTQVLGTDAILYGDFIDPTVDQKLYTNLTDMDQISKSLHFYMDEYNGQTTRPMDLVLFLDAIAHICRIARIIRQPMGNALLLGMGGSGRQSLTRLAAYMAEYFCFQIELSKTYGLTEWREDIKKLMLKAGLQRRESVFVFSDSQIKSEAFLEDLNNILNSGNVPNIYQPDELDSIYQGMKSIAQEMGLLATKSNLFTCYQRQVRSNLHCVITMSPIGEIFRARLRQFPALVNCCTIDWFSAWPDSALRSVAMHILKDIGQQLNISSEVLQGIIVVFQYMHASVVKASETFLLELSRHNYVTPKSYLQLLGSYSDLITKKKGALIQGAARLTTGLQKLHTTSEDIKVLQAELEVLKPALEIAAADAELMIALIAKDQVIVEETMAIVEKEESEAMKKAEETQAIAADAERDLEAALPALEAAEASLKSLNKNDISEVRTMQRPPFGVRVVIEAICIVKGIKPNRVPGPKLGEKINDYWEPGRAMLADPNAFLLSLMNFDKDSITEEMINKLDTYVNDAGFQPAKIAKVSKACTSLCMWIHAMYKFYFVNMQVMPKKRALAKAKLDLAETERALAKAKARLQIITERLNDLNAKLAGKIAFKNEQERNINLCMERMTRAVRLINGLAEEKLRWIATIKNIDVSQINIIGDVLISAGSVAYLTPFTDKYRRELLDKWHGVVAERQVPHTANCTPVSILGEAIVIRQWQLDGLPRDYLSTENAVLASSSKRWPLFIDPQGQANKWVKNTGKDKGILICKLSDRDLLRTLESAIRFGKPVLIENIGTELDPALDPVLNRQVFKQGSTLMLKLGDVVLPYNDDFQLFITTKLPNPHYTPEVALKVLLVNFALVPSGLQDQLLALVVMQERPDLEEQRSAIIVSVAQMKQELKEIEDRILYKLSASEGSPVDDIEFIITLEASKVKSEDIKNKVEAAEITQIDIEHTRAQYIPVANRGQILFFCVSDLANIDPMYQYSLEWFINIFVNSMASTEKTDNLPKRVEIINDHFTFSLYSNVCRSLFEKHKLHFAFLMCARILMDQQLIDNHEWHHFLAGGSPISNLPNPASTWLSNKSWKDIMSLEVLPTFKSFIETIEAHLLSYKVIFESPEPHRVPLPAPFNTTLDSFQKLIVLKCLRPDKVTNAMQDFLTEKIGARFVEPQTTDLSAMYKESSAVCPLIFVLSTGTDPAASLYKFAEKMKFTKRMFSISLGQGQGPRAEALIEEGIDAGNWVFFQNCHLAPSWMPRLDRLVESIPIESVHKEFRIWLTSTPSPHFPVSILQNGSKMTVEPPRGVKANMLKAYLNDVTDKSEFFNSTHEKVFTFKWLLFSLCLFHAVLLERRKFGPLGFNIPYEFTDGDLKICISQLHMFLLEYDEIPFKVLTYTAGHINYGGRVTDDWDRRCLLNVLSDFYSIDVIDPTHKFDEINVYHQLPGETVLADYIEYIKTFPINDDPDLFGLHANADISSAQNLTYTCLQTLLSLQPKEVGGASASQEEVTTNVSTSILSNMPSLFVLERISEKYPVMYEESLNTVIVQEAIRYNKLLAVIKSTLNDLLKAVKGLVVMSEALEKMSGSLFSNMVPALWSAKAYPSLKPLGSWVEDLKARCSFLQTWVDQGIPPAFWISGFYFPQAFLTGTLQNYARKYVLSIDTINFRFEVLEARPKEQPEDGCCVYGLFVEGARWSEKDKVLGESNPKELYTDMPPIWLIPEEYHTMPDNVYQCPVYKTLTRAGTLSTTGHSTNFVLAMEVPSSKPEKHWVKRGVALICALDY